MLRNVFHVVACLANLANMHRILHVHQLSQAFRHLSRIFTMMKNSPGRHKSPRRGTSILLIWHSDQFATMYYAHSAIATFRYNVSQCATPCILLSQRATSYLKLEPFIKCQTMTRDPRAKKISDT